MVIVCLHSSAIESFALPNPNAFCTQAQLPAASWERSLCFSVDGTRESNGNGVSDVPVYQCFGKRVQWCDYDCLAQKKEKNLK